MMTDTDFIWLALSVFLALAGIVVCAISDLQRPR